MNDESAEPNVSVVLKHLGRAVSEQGHWASQRVQAQNVQNQDDAGASPVAVLEATATFLRSDSFSLPCLPHFGKFLLFTFFHHIFYLFDSFSVLEA